MTAGKQNQKAHRWTGFLVISYRDIAQTCRDEVKERRWAFVSTLAAKGSLGKLCPLLSGADDLMTKDVEDVKVLSAFFCLAPGRSYYCLQLLNEIAQRRWRWILSGT